MLASIETLKLDCRLKAEIHTGYWNNDCFSILNIMLNYCFEAPLVLLLNEFSTPFEIITYYEKAHSNRRRRICGY